MLVLEHMEVGCLLLLKLTDQLPAQHACIALQQLALLVCTEHTYAFASRRAFPFSACIVSFQHSQYHVA